MTTDPNDRPGPQERRMIGWARKQDPDEPRPLTALRLFRDLYPDAFRDAERIREGALAEAATKPGTGPPWPEWCYVPMRDVFSIPSVPNFGDRDEGIANVLAALFSWRMTKGVYCFDGTTLEALWGTPQKTREDGDIPVEHLRRLPEWCPYVRFPEGFEPARFTFPDGQRVAVRGMFVYLDSHHRAPSGERGDDLLFVADLEDLSAGVQNFQTQMIRLNLAGRSVEGSIRAVEEETDPERMRQARESGSWSFLEAFARPFVSIALYLCAANADVAAADGSGRGPRNPEPRRTKKRRAKEFASREIREWKVGWRVGSALRRALREHEGNAAPAASGTGTNLRPHLRRAHFHRYRVGPRDEGRTELRWIHPILVNAGKDDVDKVPAVLRPVG